MALLHRVLDGAKNENAKYIEKRHSIDVTKLSDETLVIYIQVRKCHRSCTENLSSQLFGFDVFAQGSQR